LVEALTLHLGWQAGRQARPPRRMPTMNLIQGQVCSLQKFFLISHMTREFLFPQVLLRFSLLLELLKK